MALPQSSFFLTPRLPLLRLSRVQHLCPGSALQSFHPDSPQFALPPPGIAPRPYQGLDMRKLYDYPWINVWKTRRQMRTGYQWANWGGPQIDAMTYQEVATFFNNKNFMQDYTVGQLARAFWPHLRWASMMLTSLTLTVGPIVAYILWLTKFESMEVHMPQDEWFENYRWHYWGPDLDHHAFSQYLEARRAVKYRNADINPKDWIPPKYRVKEEKAENSKKGKTEKEDEDEE